LSPPGFPRAGFLVGPVLREGPSVQLRRGFSVRMQLVAEVLLADFAEVAVSAGTVVLSGVAQEATAKLH
jgi:hypothetical protein